MRAHTLGPWKLVQESVDGAWHIITAPGGRIMVNIHIESGNQMDAANARLIIAAPDMADVLRDVAALLPNAGMMHPQDLLALQTRVCAALAKAGAV